MTKRNQKNQATTTTQAMKHDAAKKAEAKLNFEQMTFNYFYPPLFAKKVQALKIPTVEELKFLTTEDVEGIRSYLRGGEKQLKTLRTQASRELAQLHVLNFGRLPSKATCDWHGTGYTELPLDVSKELMNNDCFEMRHKLVKKREEQIFACQFGYFVAQWCSMNPQPCKGDACFALTAEEAMTSAEQCNGHISFNISGLDIPATQIRTPQKPVCPHYAACHGSTPYEREACILHQRDPRTIADCGRYIKSKLAKIEEQLDFIARYMHNVSAALNKMPPFNTKPALNLAERIDLGSSGEKVVELSNNAEGFEINSGFNNGLMLDPNTRRRFLQLKFIRFGGSLEDSDSLQAEVRTVELRGSSQPEGKLYLKLEDFMYLVKNPEYRQLWLKMNKPLEYRFAGTALTELFEDCEKYFAEKAETI